MQLFIAKGSKTMSAGIVVVKKELLGEEFSTTYGFMVGDDSVPLSEADLGAALDAATLGADQTVAVSPKIINAIVDWEIAMNFVHTRITNVYVTDGRNQNPGGDATTIFYSKNLAVTGNRAMADSVNIAPGAVTLMISRVPGGFSARQGRMFLRGVMEKGSVGIAGKKLISWATPASKDAYLTIVNTALTTSGLNTHLLGGTNSAGGVLAIPHYQRPSTPPVFSDGNLIGATPVASLQVEGPTARQVGRGRREN